MKKCRKCGEEKPLSEFFWVQASRPERGHRARCKACVSTAGNQKTPEELAAKAAKQRGWRAKNPEQKWAIYLRRYGLTPEDYFRILEQQGGACAICGKPESLGTRFSVDHDHACCPGNTSCGSCNRGLLCRSCNIGLGMFQDDIQALTRAINYLRGDSL